MKWDHAQSCKALIRQLLIKARLGRLLNAVRKYRGYELAHLEPESAEDRFRAVYQLGAWVHKEGQASKSGLGSEAAATLNIRRELPGLLLQLGCRRLLDVGCGDWNWMRSIQLPCEYIGVDIVPEVIEENSKFAESGVRFEQANAITGALPKADVVLCREMLFHLSLADARAALLNMRDSAEWLIATSDTRIWFNADAPTGDFRLLNLCRPPFSFPEPSLSIHDDGFYSGRILGVWKADSLKKLAQNNKAFFGTRLG